MDLIEFVLRLKYLSDWLAYKAFPIALPPSSPKELYPNNLLEL